MRLLPAKVHEYSAPRSSDLTVPVRVRMLQLEVLWSTKMRVDMESDERSASTRSPGLASRDTPLCSSTPSWKQTSPPSDSGKRWDLRSLEPYLKLSSTHS